VPRAADTAQEEPLRRGERDLGAGLDGDGHHRLVDAKVELAAIGEM
jgi:hypothetical protein